MNTTRKQLNNSKLKKLTKISILFRIIIFLNIFSFHKVYAEKLNQSLFPYGEEINRRANFWKKVYSEISSAEGYLHDPEIPELIYEKLDIKGLKKRDRLRLIKKRKRYLKSLLIQVANNDISRVDKRFLSLLRKLSKKQLISASKRIRWQQGLADRFKKGFDRSYYYLYKIKKIFKEEGVPVELSYLPHVESSFNYKAYSKVGAAGIWQFMRYTARLFNLKVNYIIDERLDPLVAARAAARLLKMNYQKLQSWPLALTAYNHGAGGVAYAVKKTKSIAIDDIVKKFKGRRFGFASKNFFATFVASYEIATNLEKKLTPKDLSENFFKLKLSKRVRIKSLLEVLDLKTSEFKKFNRAIRKTAYKNNLSIARGNHINLPIDLKDKESSILSEISNIIEDDFKNGEIITHIISRGETLYDLSLAYKVPIGYIINFNEIINPSKIFPGKKILIPLGGSDKEFRFNRKKKIVNTHDLSDRLIVKKPSYSISKRVSDFYKEYKLRSFELEYFFVSRAQNKISDPTKVYDLSVDRMSKNVFRIKVQPNETIGHYSDWGNIKIKNIRNINSFGRRSNIQVGDLIDIPMEKGRIGVFNSSRIEFHQMIEEDFYDHFKITGTKSYKVRRGDSIQEICRREDIPLWLFAKYFKASNIELKIYVGQVLTLPVIEELSL